MSEDKKTDVISAGAPDGESVPSHPETGIDTPSGEDDAEVHTSTRAVQHPATDPSNTMVTIILKSGAQTTLYADPVKAGEIIGQWENHRRGEISMNTLELSNEVQVGVFDIEEIAAIVCLHAMPEEVSDAED